MALKVKGARFLARNHVFPRLVFRLLDRVPTIACVLFVWLFIGFSDIYIRVRSYGKAKISYEMDSM